jgi:hypothetical protein
VKTGKDKTAPSFQFQRAILAMQKKKAEVVTLISQAQAQAQVDYECGLSENGNPAKANYNSETVPSSAVNPSQVAS